MNLQNIILYGLILLPCSAIAEKQVMTDIDKQQIFIGEGIAETKTEYGDIRGYKIRDIYAFLGIPYGEDTSGKNRFLPPQPPKSWDGIRPTVAFGASSPQKFYDRQPESYSMFVDHWNYDEMNEDCLRLNVWTPGINDTKKRPVLVWLHGGGFTNGNGIEQDGYNGENIARYGDIVFCSINHRLGPLGFCDLSFSNDKRFAESANVGMLDIVAALKWIKNNISNFGGDPDNVTIMGQSGGGAKVCLLCAMPSAKGLFHKAIALSGNTIKANSKEYSTALGSKVMEAASLDIKSLDSLQNLPVNEFMSLADKAYTSMSGRESGWRNGFSPVADGNTIPFGTFFINNNMSIGSDVPMILSTTFHEWNPDRDDPQYENISLEKVADKIRWQYGDKAKNIVNGYAAAFPNFRPIELWSMIASNRKNVVATADAKCRQKSPVYMAWFGWQSPLFNGRHRAFHCIDISFWFLNTDLMLTHTGGGESPRRLSYKMADALIAFMKTGNPNCDALPFWPKYTSEKGTLMIFNNVCRTADDPDREARKQL